MKRKNRISDIYDINVQKSDTYCQKLFLFNMFKMTHY